MAERFYLNLPLGPGPVEMSGPEAHHLAQVSRLGAGARVTLFNGDGKEYIGQVRSAARRSVVVEIDTVSRPERELPFQLHIAAALPKGDRAQFLIEKLTELGVTSFTPLLCERSVVQPGAGKLEKLERYVVEASKQCGRNVLLKVEEPAAWETFLRRGNDAELRLLAHPGAAEETFPGALGSGAVVRAALGPEGGFTAAEVALARNSGWRLFALGPRVLRIETAALVVAAWAARSNATKARAEAAAHIADD
jgi:16S rRNA (uracil1498-N3)-methyltransferase